MFNKTYNNKLGNNLDKMKYYIKIFNFILILPNFKISFSLCS
jgi:hypothetical protein